VVEQLTRNEQVSGSNPLVGFGLLMLISDVTGSFLVLPSFRAPDRTVYEKQTSSFSIFDGRRLIRRPFGAPSS
jgi:hypothetical protein